MWSFLPVWSLRLLNLHFWNEMWPSLTCRLLCRICYPFHFFFCQEVHNWHSWHLEKCCSIMQVLILCDFTVLIIISGVYLCIVTGTGCTNLTVSVFHTSFKRFRLSVKLELRTVSQRLICCDSKWYVKMFDENVIIEMNYYQRLYRGENRTLVS